MSILGKLLIVFNLLAAAAFTYFTVENWRVRQEITWAAINRQMQLEGFAVEAQATPPTSDELGSDRVAFYFVGPGGLVYQSIPKDRFEKLVPRGGEEFGGAPVANQTDEVKRLKDVVAASIPAQGEPRFAALRTYLINLARTGAERDGVNSLFDLRGQPAARGDLPHLARTPSQSAALRAMIDIADLGDPQAPMPEAVRTSRVNLAREAVSNFVKGEVAHLEQGNALRNAALDTLRPGAGEAQKSAVEAAAGNDKPSWEQIAKAGVEPLTDRPSCDRAIAALLAFAQSKATVPTEIAALNEIKELIRNAHRTALPAGFSVDKSIESAALNLLNAKFDDAQQPAAASKTAKGDPLGQKARKIAHLLYNIDAHRHANRDQAVVAARKAWHERVATIVGLPEYIRAAEAQASEFAEASQRLIAVITEEQSAFEAEYQAQIQQVELLFARWQILDNQFKVQQGITAESERLKNERLTEKNNLITALADATEKAKQANENLKKTQARLFAIQRDLRDAQAAILALEKELRKLELGEQ